MDSLDRALALWRASPTPRHTVLVWRASDVVRRDVVLRDEWLDVEAAGDPADVTRLIASLAIEPVPAGVERLALRPADPRIVAAFVELFESRQRWSDFRLRSSAWTTAMAYLRAHGNATYSPRLGELATQLSTHAFMHSLAPKLAALASELYARPVPVDVDSPAALELTAELERLEQRRRVLEHDVIVLFEAVWASPDDDGLRFVLADFLNEHAEPRGEFIALQLAHHAGKLGASGRKREKKLLARNKAAWIGTIAPLVRVGDARFDRGFIAACRLVPNVELEPTLVDHAAWSTVREYTVHPLALHSALAVKLDARGATRVDQLTLGTGT